MGGEAIPSLLQERLRLKFWLQLVPRLPRLHLGTTDPLGHQGPSLSPSLEKINQLCL